MRTVDAPAEALLQRAMALHRESRFEEARALYESILASHPKHSRTWHLLGMMVARSGDPQQALILLRQAIDHDPRNVAAHNDAGNLLCSLRRFEEAVQSFDAVIALDSKFAGGYYNRGAALYDLGRLRTAIEAFDLAIALDPSHARAHHHRGQALEDLALYREAWHSYDRAISLRSDYADAHNGRGNALIALQEYASALLSFDAAIAVQPAYADAHNNRGNALYQLGRTEEALISYEAALRLQPDYPGVNLNRGHLLAGTGRHAEALASFERAIALAPDLPYARGDLLLARMQICDWREYDLHSAELLRRVEKGEPVATPFCMLVISDSAALQKVAAQHWIERNALPAEVLPTIARRSGAKKIRLGYFSVDFRNHPVARLAAELFELHDRTRFEVIAFSLGQRTQDDLRKRLESAFDRFIDVQEKSDAQIAVLARHLQIDIAVDLTGLTKHCRPKVFAQRAAPVQVSYLGYLGTSGAPWIDYLIADETLIPSFLRSNYAESVAYLPSYQANDSKRLASNRTFSRHELGLPAAGFVFCCFNTNYKIAPAVFESWMRILARVPDAVLWLYVESTAAAGNLRTEARNRGIDPQRIVFAGRMATPDYLARYRSADLFLDTLPYNAGTTASDALWAGLPVLTCVGETFPSRMAASLLEALGMPELISSSAAQYEEMAVKLASRPEHMALTRRKLTDCLRTAPLFDARRHTRTVEMAYVRMHERYDQGLPPTDMTI